MNGATREGADGTPIPPFSPSTPGGGARREEKAASNRREDRGGGGFGIWSRAGAEAVLLRARLLLHRLQELPTPSGLGEQDPSFGVLRWTPDGSLDGRGEKQGR